MSRARGNDGAEGLQAALLDPPDLVVLDLTLPSLDGLTVLARLREAHSSARILILTALGGVADRVKGLKAGADDYLAKPFSMNELMARVEALGRRAATPTAAELLKVGDLQMDVSIVMSRGRGRRSFFPRGSSTFCKS